MVFLQMFAQIAGRCASLIFFDFPIQKTLNAIHMLAINTIIVLQCAEMFPNTTRRLVAAAIQNGIIRMIFRYIDLAVGIIE